MTVPHAPSVEALRHRLRALGAEDYVRRTVDAAPPLAPERLDRIAALLRPAPERAA